MAFRQTYKGIFQFKDQETLELAMAEIQAEALSADAMGFQDSFRGEGVILLDISAMAEEQDWEEMEVALATLAMHASKGFAYAVAIRENGTHPVVEFYEADGGGKTPIPKNSDSAPAIEADYFPMSEGANFVFRSLQDESKVFNWTTHKYSVGDRDYFFFQDKDATNVQFNEYWDGTYYYKNSSLVGTVAAGTKEELEQTFAELLLIH